jgi:hypothetical protein
MSKPNFRPIAPLDVDDRALERVNDSLGVPTMVRPPAKVQRDDPTASRPAVPAPRRQQKLTVRIPGYLVDALKRNALEQRTTVRHLVLLALQKDGYSIEAADLMPGAGGSD